MKKGEYNMSASARQKIEELYKRFLTVTRLEEKEKLVLKLSKQLSDEGIVKEWDGLRYDYETGDVYNVARQRDEKILDMLWDIKMFLGARDVTLFVTTQEIVDDTHAGSNRFVNRARKLGMIIKTEVHDDIVLREACYEIARLSENDLTAIAYVCFDERVEDP